MCMYHWNMWGLNHKQWYWTQMHSDIIRTIRTGECTFWQVIRRIPLWICGKTYTRSRNDNGETTDDSNFLIILDMSTKTEVPNEVLTLINLLGGPKRIHSDNTPEYSSQTKIQIYKTHNIVHTTTTPWTPYVNDRDENGWGLIKHEPGLCWCRQS